MPPVVVALDGSARAETVIPAARVVAAGAPITLVTTRWGNDARPAQEYLDRQAVGIAGEVRTTVIQDREATEAILLVARDEPSSIIGMATHGRSGIGEAVLGSVAESVVRRADRPVLLVGPHVDTDRDLASDLVVAVDAPETADAIAGAAADLATTLSVGVSAVEVAPAAPVPFTPELDMMGWPEDGKAADAAFAALVRAGRRAERHVLREPDPARAIVRFAAGLPASFVVVGTHAREGLARVALGSIAMRVVHRSPCPVLVVRA